KTPAAAETDSMQNEQLAYVAVTPYSMRKSRTGGIVGRLISRTGLDLVGGRMFAPGLELTKRYAEAIVTETHPRHRATQELIREYVLKNFTSEKNGHRPRVLFLVFRGPEAVEKIRGTVGHIVHERTSGETIRDTFGDYITDDSGEVTYFEPGVLAAFDAEAVEHDLRLWAEFSDSDGGILDCVIKYPAGNKIEKTLVLIKPEKREEPGTEKCIAIVYQGVGAVGKIREVLGPTDPAKAPPGSIRKEFGQTIMINAAHASDSVENAQREMAIVRIAENNFKPLIENFYARNTVRS